MIFDALLPARLSGTANPDQWLIDWVRDGQMTPSGETINEETALTCAAVYAAVRILSEGIASLPLELFERLPDGRRRAAEDHSLYRVLHDEPNPEMDSYTWREAGQGHLCTYGNAYSEIQRAVNGQVVALWPLSPKRTRPFREDDGTIKYEHRTEAGEKEILAADDVLHVPGFGFDGLVGYSPIRKLKNAIAYNKAGERYASELFANDAAYAGALEVPGPLSDRAYKRLQDAQAARAEHGKRHRTLILEEGTKFAKTSMHPDDVQMIEARRFGVEEIARAYRISQHLLQLFTEGAASYSSIVELGREFLVFTLMPWIRKWEGQINRRLLDEKHFCKFNTRGFLQADHAARAEFYTKLFSCGGITINQILELEDEDPIGPEGDVRFVPLNIQPLEKAIKPEKPKPPPPLPPPVAPKEEEEKEEEESKGEEAKANEEQMGRLLAEIRAEYDELKRRRQERNEQAARQVIADVMGRLRTKERKAAERAAHHPERFLAWLDGFYAHHERTLAEALHNPMAALLAAQDKTADAAAAARRFAGNICNASRQSLLTAAECRPAELPNRVAAVFSAP